MLSKLEFEIQKYDKDINVFIDHEKIFNRRSKINSQLFILFTILTIISSILILVSLFIEISIFKDSVNLLMNAVKYSVTAIVLVLIARFLINISNKFHTKELVKEVQDSSRTSSVVDMDNYKGLVNRITIVNFQSLKRIRYTSVFIAFLNIFAVIFALTSVIFVLFCVFEYTQVVDTKTLQQVLDKDPLRIK